MIDNLVVLTPHTCHHAAASWPKKKLNFLNSWGRVKAPVGAQYRNTSKTCRRETKRDTPPAKRLCHGGCILRKVCFCSLVVVFCYRFKGTRARIHNTTQLGRFRIYIYMHTSLSFQIKDGKRDCTTKSKDSVGALGEL